MNFDGGYENDEKVERKVRGQKQNGEKMIRVIKKNLKLRKKKVYMDFLVSYGSLDYDPTHHFING